MIAEQIIAIPRKLGSLDITDDAIRFGRWNENITADNREVASWAFITRARFCCGLVLLCLLAANLVCAQTPDEQQLKAQVQQLEQLTQELKTRIAILERAESGAPHVLNAVLTQPPDGQYPLTDPTVVASALGGSTEAATPIVASAVKEMTLQGVADSKSQDSEPRLDIYGFAMLDMGYDFGQNDPNYFDTMRPTRLPAFTNEFGQNGRLFDGVRQSRFGVKGYLPTKLGVLKTIFEYELFGVGAQAGQTTFRLRHAWGELGQFGAGQTWSVFMDPDVFPNSLEYWGPNGMVFFRNVQFRWSPINKGNKQLMFALERPGASADLGQVQDRIELSGVQARFPAPDVTGHVRVGGDRTYLQLAGIFRYIAWDDLKAGPALDLSGDTFGWGVNVSSNVGVGKKDTVKMSVVYGDGVENYMNDAPVDIAPVTRLNPRTPIDGSPLPVLGVVAFYDRYWSDRWSSSVGYSLVNIQNVPLQNASDFHRGQYGLANLLFYPVKNAMMGGEFQWGRRSNFLDGFVFNDYRVQFSFKYNFNYTLGGGK